MKYMEDYYDHLDALQDLATEEASKLIDDEFGPDDLWDDPENFYASPFDAERYSDTIDEPSYEELYIDPYDDYPY